MNKNFVKLDENYYLISQEVNSTATVEVAKKTNHIFVVDVSGSMSGDLPLIRTQLKNKLSNLMKEGDTISIVWFSGNRDAGILKEEVEVKSLKTLTDLHDAIDRWLRPIGLTAFQKPLELTKELIGRTGSFSVFPNPAKGPVTLFFNTLENNGSRITVSDMEGNDIFHKEIPENQAQFNLDLSGYPRGIYFFTIQAGSRKSTSQLILQ